MDDGFVERWHFLLLCGVVGCEQTLLLPQPTGDRGKLMCDGGTRLAILGGRRDRRARGLRRVMGWTPPDGICVPR
jgi:hypothetical protein